MALHFTSNLIYGTDTPHTATEQDGTWTVTWLPGRLLSRSQAVSAMQIAVAVGGSVEPGDLRFLHIEGWAGELGMSGSDAVAMASKPPA